MKRILLFLLLCILFQLPVSAQDYAFHLKKASSTIVLDGEFDEQAWQDAEVITNFYNSKPVDTSFAKSITEVRMTYNENFLYVSAICYDELEGDYIVQSLKRDFSFPRTDAFAVFIDPYNDGTNGFSFGCNPYGAQREGVLEAGGRYGVTTAWDNKWYSKTKISEGKWTIEMAIPFKTLRFKEGMSEWRINFARHDQKRNEESTWVPVPVNFNVAHLGYTGRVIWDEPTRTPGANVSVIPYLSMGSNKQFVPENKPVDITPDAGFDAKIGITSSLNLDVTVNPDFSHVEVDRQVTNIDRFELFFPERRQFFIENNDLFGSLGTSRTSPFFSRRVGLGTDSLGRTVENPILAGLRLSGKINNNWRIGVLNIQTKQNEVAGIDGQNYAMAISQHKFWKRSNFSAFMVNRQGFGSDSSNKKAFNTEDFNRVLGADLKLLSSDGKFNMHSYTHKVLTPFDSLEDTWSIGNSFEYDTKKLYVGVFQEYVGEDYKSDVGYTPRVGYYHYKPEVAVFYYPQKTSLFNYHKVGSSYDFYTNISHQKIEHSAQIYYEVRFMSTAKINIGLVDEYIQLQRDFNPSRTPSGLKLKAGEGYAFSSLKLTAQTNERKNIFFSIDNRFGEYFNGKRLYLSASARYRIAPKINITVDYAYTDIVLPTPYSSANYHLLGTQFDMSFTTKLFFTTFVQYNTQIDNVNINSRLQWRFKPASDLFLVYTDNYFPETMLAKSRAVVLKFTYWFNL